LLSFFNKRNSGPTINLETVFQEEAVSFKLVQQFKKEKRALRFPLTNVPVAIILASSASGAIAALELLYTEGYLRENEGGYELPYSSFYELEPEMLTALGLPSSPANVYIELESEGIVGTSDFKFKPMLAHPQLGPLNRFSKRYGPMIITANDEKVLLEKSAHDLLVTIDEIPEKTVPEDNLRYVAKVKKYSEAAGAKLDSYIERENYTFIDEVEIDAILNDPTSLSLASKYKTDNPELEPVLEELTHTGKVYGIAGGNVRNRVLISPEAVAQAKQIQEIPLIQGSNVPKFIENPAAFLPDSLTFDLSEFGERVKNLGVRVYRSQPYIHANQNERGWFNFNRGVRRIDKTNPEANEEEIDLDTFKQLVDKAKETGERFIFQEGIGWTEVIPEDGQSFLDAERELEQHLRNGKELDPTSLSYVLEIFTNLNEVEFNKPLLELKQSLHDSGVLDPPPDSFQGQLFPYQIEGFRWLKMLDFGKMGGLLADDMGLGKTVQVVAFISHLKKSDRLKPALVIAPLSLLENWKNELQKFCSDINLRDIYIHQGPSRLKTQEVIESFDIVLTSYDTLVRDQLLLGKIDWVCTICDEAQKIKNSTTATATVVKALKSKFRLALTGTPVENGLSELWSIVDYVQPGLLGSLKYFQDTYEKPISNSKAAEDLSRIEDELLSIIQPVYKRRTKQEHLSHVLPRKDKELRFVELGPEQYGLYVNVIEQVKNKHLNGLQAIHALRKVCSHPALYDSSYDTLPLSHVPKLGETIKILREIYNRGEKALIFTDYKKMQMILSQVIMKEFGVFPPVINGETSQRQLVVDTFNRSKGFNVMILSPKAGGTGLTITGANHVIHYTRWWNPAVENQATDRAYRIGQQKDVKVYYPIVTSPSGRTMEELLDNLLKEKEELAYKVVVPSRLLDCNDELLKELQVI
jgi:superfamily II DNA or RNA helicase